MYGATLVKIDENLEHKHTGQEKKHNHHDHHKMMMVDFKKRFVELSLYFVSFGAYNNWVSCSGLKPSLKSPSVTSDTRRPLSEIAVTKIRK